MTALFRETTNLPAERRPSLLMRLRPSVDYRDALAGLGFLSLCGGLGMIWLPLAFVVGGGLLLAFALYVSLPRAA